MLIHMKYFMQKYPYFYTFQWINAILYASGKNSTLGENIACTAISVFALG